MDLQTLLLIILLAVAIFIVGRTFVNQFSTKCGKCSNGSKKLRQGEKLIEIDSLSESDSG